ncbi:MAG: DUF6580 family putative transport protein [Candidatus Saccharimonadales bacterium]
MKISEKKLQVVLALILVALVVFSRLLPHPANFAPVAAVAIFSGAYFSRKLALVVPIVAMFLSDFLMGSYDMIFIVGGCYAAIGLASSYWLKRPNLLRGGALTLAGSAFFFLVTNFAVWIWSGMYEHTWTGLILCYEMGLPFFRGTVLGDIIYTLVLFGAMVLAMRLARRSQLLARQGHDA